jgi:O-antigen/teichoic acid export membrane protein
MLLEIGSAHGNPALVRAGSSAATALMTYHRWQEYENGTTSVSYYPDTNDETINTCADVAALLALLPPDERSSQSLRLLTGLVRLVLTEQQPDGSWRYCTASHYRRHSDSPCTDNHHSAQVLQALARCFCSDSLPFELNQQIAKALKRGLSYYCQAFYHSDGRGTYFPSPSKRPAEIVGYSEGLAAIYWCLRTEVLNDFETRSQVIRNATGFISQALKFLDPLRYDVGSAFQFGRLYQIRSIRWGSGPLLEAMMYAWHLSNSVGSPATPHLAETRHPVVSTLLRKSSAFQEFQKSGMTLAGSARQNLRALLYKFPKNAFVRNVGILAGGTTLARAIAAGVSPVLTRIYLPSDFGLLAVFFSVVTAAVTAAALNYDQAIPSPKNDEVAAGLVLWAFCLLLVNASLIALAVVLLPHELARMLGAPELQRYLWLVPVSVLGGGTFCILNSWAVRTASFNSLSKRRVWQALAQSLVQLLVPVIAPGPLGLLLGDSAGRAAGSATLLRELSIYLKRHNLRLSFGTARRASRMYSRYPTFGLLALILHVSLTVLPPLLLTAHFGSSVTGSYTLTSQVIGMGSSLIGLSVAQVYVNKAAVFVREEVSQLRSLFVRTSAVCAAIAAGPFLCLACFGPTIFRTFFGARWIQAGEFARILALPYFIMFVVGPVFPVLALLQRQPWQLGIDAVGAALMIGLILAAARLHLGPEYAVAGFGISMAVTYLCLYAAAALAIWSKIRSSVLTEQLVFHEEPQCH